jgi:putative NADH-flavin reductase
LLGQGADFRNPAEDLLGGGMTSYLYERQVRIFDYPGFAEPYRNELREKAEHLAAEAGVEIEFIRTQFPKRGPAF